MPSWLVPRRERATEASPAQVIATGAGGGGWGQDPIDGDYGWRPAGGGSNLRAVPRWTLEKARTFSVAAYRSNPMARAIIDTYVSFAVGDSGVSYQVTNPQVAAVVDQFWNDPRNNVGGNNALLFRGELITGETALEMMTGPVSGVVRFSPIEPALIEDVSLLHGNPLWPHELLIQSGSNDALVKQVVAVDDATGLRDGEVQFWAPFKTLPTDTRSMPFMTPILDWLDSYDTVLSNLIDRTALARYLVWDVTVEGGQTEVDNFVKARGGTHVPRSGSVEVHNAGVKWEAKTAPTGAEEDHVAAKSVLTLVAGGSGLARTWLADPEDANRATSQSMAEPVRRRVGGVQKVWLGQVTELVRFAVDRAVASKRLPAKVEATDPRTGQSYEIPASQCVTVTGPEIAAADAQITAQTLLNLSTGLQQFVEAGIMSAEAARVAGKKAWEDYVGVPYTADLDKPDANPGDLATAVDDAERRRAKLRPA